MADQPPATPERAPDDLVLPDGKPVKPPPIDTYRMPRIVVAGAFTFQLVLLGFLDALLPEYTLEPVTLIVLVTVIAAMLSVEIRDFIRR